MLLERSEISSSFSLSNAIQMSKEIFITRLLHDLFNFIGHCILSLTHSEIIHVEKKIQFRTIHREWEQLCRHNQEKKLNLVYLAESRTHIHTRTYVKLII